MPYKSQAQAAYMHIHHPEIAARWDKEYGGSKKKKKKISKSYIPGKGFVSASKLGKKTLREAATKPRYVSGHARKIPKGSKTRYNEDLYEPKARLAATGVRGTEAAVREFERNAQNALRHKTGQVEPLKRKNTYRVYAKPPNPNAEASVLTAGGGKSRSRNYIIGPRNASPETIKHEMAHARNKSTRYAQATRIMNSAKRGAEEGKADMAAGVRHTRQNISSAEDRSFYVRAAQTRLPNKKARAQMREARIDKDFIRAYKKTQNKIGNISRTERALGNPGNRMLVAGGVGAGGIGVNEAALARAERRQKTGVSKAASRTFRASPLLQERAMKVGRSMDRYVDWADRSPVKHGLLMVGVPGAAGAYVGSDETGSADRWRKVQGRPTRRVERAQRKQAKAMVSKREQKRDENGRWVSMGGRIRHKWENPKPSLRQNRLYVQQATPLSPAKIRQNTRETAILSPTLSGVLGAATGGALGAQFARQDKKLRRTFPGLYAEPDSGPVTLDAKGKPIKAKTVRKPSVLRGGAKGAGIGLAGGAAMGAAMIPMLTERHKLEQYPRYGNYREEKTPGSHKKKRLSRNLAGKYDLEVHRLTKEEMAQRKDPAYIRAKAREASHVTKDPVARALLYDAALHYYRNPRKKEARVVSKAAGGILRAQKPPAMGVRTPKAMTPTKPTMLKPLKPKKPKGIKMPQLPRPPRPGY